MTGSETMMQYYFDGPDVIFLYIGCTPSLLQHVEAVIRGHLLHPASAEGVIVLTSCVCVCPSGCTQGTLYTTTTVYVLLVHQEGAICTTQAQYAPRCTRETMFLSGCVYHYQSEKSLAHCYCYRRF